MKTKKNTSIIDKYKGSNKSLAAISKEIADKYPNRNSDLVEKESFKTELQALHDYQEQLRLQDQVQESINQYMCGGKIKKYQTGGDVDPNYVPGVDLPIGEVPLGINPFTTMENILPPTNYQEPVYGTRPETIFSYRNSSLNPETAVKPFDSEAYQPTSFMDKVKGFFSKNDMQTSTFKDVNGTPNIIDNNQGVSKPEDAPKTKSESSAYTPALVGQGLSTLLNAGILAQGYDKVRPVNNPYEGDIKRLMQERGIDTTQQRNQILSGYNAARQNLNNVRSGNVRNALDANLMGITQDNLAQSKLQEQQINQGFKADLANSLNNLGQQRVQATTYADELTARNKGQFESNLSKFGDLMAQHGESFSAFKANQNMNNVLAQLLNEKYAASNLGISQEIVDRFNSGKATEKDWIELKNKIKDANPSLEIPDFKVQ